MKKLLSTNIQRKNQLGFTLLEMVMVIFIMGILASVSLTFLDTQSQQWRFDETERKLDSVERALLFQPANQRLLMSGFVVDNGVLPPPVAGTYDLEPLITRLDSSGNTLSWFADAGPPATQRAEYGALSPYYNLDGNNRVLTATYSLRKGYRGGYLKAGVDSKQELRDGWGDAFIVGGPTLLAPTAPYQVDFAARPPEFRALSKTLNTADWQTSLSSLEFSLSNRIDPSILITPTTPLGSELGATHELAVLVFSNKRVANAEDRWDTYHFTIPGPPLTAAPFASGDTRSFSAASQTWYKNGGATALTPAELAAVWLPPGEHMVVILHDGDISSGNTSPPDFRRFKLYPRTLHDAIALDITAPTP